MALRKRKTQQGPYPHELILYKDKLKQGKMIPLRIEAHTVALVIIEADNKIRNLKKDPIVEAVPASIQFGDVSLVRFLIRIDENSEYIYETGFDVLRKECVSDLKDFCAQPKVSIILLGDKEWTGIECGMKEVQCVLKAHMELALGKEPDWSDEDYQKGIRALKLTTKNPAQLWSIIERDGQIMRIGQNPADSSLH